MAKKHKKTINKLQVQTIQYVHDPKAANIIEKQFP
jgi:hypothetical protein